MGRVQHSEIVAIRCELATPRASAPRCDAVEPVTPVPATATWRQQVDDLARLVDAGWTIILASRLRAYCPDHAEEGARCSCATHPERAHLCVIHGDTGDLYWTRAHEPIEITRELNRNGATS